MAHVDSHRRVGLRADLGTVRIYVGDEVAGRVAVAINLFWILVRGAAFGLRGCFWIVRIGLRCKDNSGSKHGGVLIR